MEVHEIVDALQYTDSPNYVDARLLAQDPENGFLYRRAAQKCGLDGAYLLRGTSSSVAGIPIVYVCSVKTEEQARIVHRLVWNQDLVPFLLVVSPQTLRVYPGFRFDRSESTSNDLDAGALHVLRSLNRVTSDLASFRAEAIDTGRLWKERAAEVTSETRVDWRLLGHLRDLAKSLTDSGVRDVGLVHGIIGKFVYLRYLRDRDILSARKLHAWGLGEEQVFSRNLRLGVFARLLAHLDEWLNGSVFPLTQSQLQELGEDRLRAVAGVFRGDAASGQMALEFANYDFSFIPIETLSVIYEQFLHAPDPRTGISKGKEKGAYYTPVPVVNFMLDRLELRRPLEAGMRVLDPSCGSGAFLVQCYRRLIERAIRKNNGRPPRPPELSGLLTEHLFGVDTDPDACQIAELSLILTLLDYVEPPDLESPKVREFQLPSLRGKNVFHQSAFLPLSTPLPTSFDWVIGNPPWKELKPRTGDMADPSMALWSRKNRKQCPTGGRQIAELFAWRAIELLSANGAASLLMPAMTLFKYESKKFRERFFADAAVWEVANFANLANVLFGGRSKVPAAVFFFEKAMHTAEPANITVYAPFLANQPVLYDSMRQQKQREAWSITVNLGEVRGLRHRDAVSGNALPWKLASWGSFLDGQFLQRLSSKFGTIHSLEKSGAVIVAEGFQLRKLGQGDPTELEYHPELVGTRKALFKKLKERHYLWRLPERAVDKVAAGEAYVRKRGGYERPLRVCEPPHVLVPDSRAFAIYEDQFLVVPPRQIGIWAAPSKKPLLKALALYLNSDFALYHQFLTSSQAGVQKTISTERDLRRLPLPFTADENTLQPWVDLYDRIIASSSDGDDFKASPLIGTLNELVNAAFALDKRSQALVHDLIHVKLDLTHGKLGGRATNRPRKEELERYAIVLRNELDEFLGSEPPARHRIRVAVGEEAGVVEVLLMHDGTKSQPISVEEASARLSVQLALARTNARQQFAQWFYFDRNLRLYDLNRTLTYICKPLQRMHWTQTQALLDAGEIIADTLTSPTEDKVARV